MHPEYSYPYILFEAIIFLLFFSIQTVNQNGKLKKSLGLFNIYTFFLISIVFIGCRGFIGLDWNFYYPYFIKAPSIFDSSTEISKFIENSNWNIGYCLFNIFCKTFTESYFGFQLISATIDVILLHFVFERYCHKYYFLAWFLYFSFNGFGIEILYLRNAKSICLFLLSLKYVEERSFIKYLFMNILGYLFHTSAILFIPLYFLFIAKRRKRLELAIFIIGLIFFALQIEWLKKVLQIIQPFAPLKVQILIKAYLASEYFSAAYEVSLGFIERVFTFIVMYIYSDRILEHDKRLKPFWYLFLLYNYTYLFCSEFGIIIARITIFFITSYWILLPVLYGFFNKEKKILFILIFCTYTFLKIYIGQSNPHDYYENFLFNASDRATRWRLYS